MSQSDLDKWNSTMLEKVSRTFAVSISELPNPHQKYIKTAYLMCRIPDTIEDEISLSVFDKSHLLQTYLFVLENPSPSNISYFTSEVKDKIPENTTQKEEYWDLVLQTQNVFETYYEFPTNIQKIIQKWVSELTAGMKHFMTLDVSEDGLTIYTEQELAAYCYSVAGTIGNMILELITEQYTTETMTAEKYQMGVYHGLLLQYVNIMKDVHTDFVEESTTYIPESKLHQYHIQPDDILRPENQSDVGEIVTDLVQQTKEFMDPAEEFLSYIQEVAPETYTGWAIPYFLAIATLREIEDNTHLAIDEKEVKIERSEVYTIVELVNTNNDIFDVKSKIITGKTKQ